VKPTAPLNDLRAYLPSILARHYPELRATDVSAMPSQGYLNATFLFTSNSGQEWIVRVSQRAEHSEGVADWSAYHKEIWALSEAGKVGLPVATPHPHVAYFAGRKDEQLACMLQRKLAGVPAAALQAALPGVWLRLQRELGSYLKSVNSIMTQGYGSGFDHVQNRFLQDWKGYLHAEGSRYGMETILAHPLLAGGRREIFKALCLQLENKPSTAHLIHADLNDTNVLVDAHTEQITGIIDWERCAGGMAPESELMQLIFERLILGHHYPQDSLAGFISGEQRLPELESFLNGYEITWEEYLLRHHRGVLILLLLKTLPFLNWWFAEGQHSGTVWAESAACGEIVLNRSMEILS